MLLPNLRAAVRKLLGRLAQPALEDLLAPEQMRKALARERARADRTADRFAVLAFGPGPELPPDVWGCLVKALKGRLRFTDEVGWLEGGQLGAVLAGTDVQGALKVVNDVGRRLAADFPPVPCAIYVYPPDGTTREYVVVGGQAVRQAPGRPTEAVEPLFQQALPLWKRAVDVVGAALGLLLLSPLFAAVALAVKWTSNGRAAAPRGH
jgi:hypothetical protein